ncbi:MULTISPECIES: LiaF transmembrane domain-containing protein [Streptococcus]|nr:MULTISPECIES: hypothetical protein [Streptococcus]MDQ8819713.1 hypothetical protein [Streptococcus ruminantium]MDQ8836320.1 hypothetical protein [Streptococcus ruminantium]QHF55505.1 hypothetical protein BZG42_09215 [Streptococcus sp. DAT741]
MRKMFLGVGFILLALYLLFKDRLLLPDLGMSLWTLLLVLGFGYGTVQNIYRRNYISAYVCGIIAFVLLEKHYNWLNISTGTIVIAAVLAGLGLNMIFKPRHKIYGFESGESTRNTIEGCFFQNHGPDTVFTNATRYINEGNLTNVSGDTVFSGVSIYFVNANMLGDVATYSGDAVFSNVKLYVPKNWNIEFRGDKVFSSIKNHSVENTAEKTLVITGDYVFSQLEIFYV